MQIPVWLQSRVRDNRSTIKFNTLCNLGDNFCERKILKDFSAKMVNKEVRDYQDYYEQAQVHGVDLSFRVARCKTYLKHIEDSEMSKPRNLPPPVPMMETLTRYMELNGIPRINHEIELIMKIGGRHSQYYSACYAMAKVMLVGDGEKRRCVIIHGCSDSGKSYIARFAEKIFDAYWKNDTKGMFDEKITVEQQNKQLVIMNEVDIFKLCHKKNIASTKRLMEGQGWWLENKFAQPVTGFVGSYQLLTCNMLCCPFVPPQNTSSTWTR